MQSSRFKEPKEVGDRSPQQYKALLQFIIQIFATIFFSDFVHLISLDVSGIMIVVRKL